MYSSLENPLEKPGSPKRTTSWLGWNFTTCSIEQRMCPCTMCCSCCNDWKEVFRLKRSLYNCVTLVYQIVKCPRQGVGGIDHAHSGHLLDVAQKLIQRSHLNGLDDEREWWRQCKTVHFHQFRRKELAPCCGHCHKLLVNYTMLRNIIIKMELYCLC